ncbi:holo-ACP synthase [Helicobacter sp. 11S02596-1]|uniref:holo-ACP synthase n=1 Tax=Helicobacter sp. 11S02596-1 TaxID=1476194 RepID=UPI000BA5826A|nr:holo-ACP synthase [Helicobacter sp. 11S02596-1]PAF45094.1 holo-ACP synthase [Helicobacter sp. 11S02596-1]
MIGIDIASIARIEKNLARYGDIFLKKFLSDEEIKLLATPSGWKASSVAGFWAAKEACAKALGVGISEELRFFDMHLSKSPKNAPIMRLEQNKMQAFRIKSIHLSISHDGGFAIAVVSLEKRRAFGLF